MEAGSLTEEKKSIVAKMQELLEKDPIEVQRDFHRLEKEFKKVWTEIFEEQKREFVEGGGKAKDFIYIKKDEDIKFENIAERFKKKLNERKDEINREREKNLEIKKDIISRIRFLTSNSENVGAALKKLNELNSEWKATGEVPAAYYREIQSEYQKALDEFHHNLRLYRQLQEHDFKRNYELKKEILEKIRALPEKYASQVREMMIAFRSLKKEWDSIGPVFPDKWEDLKSEFKQAEDKIEEIYKSHKEEVEKELELNAQSKKAIHALMEKILNDSAGFTSSEEWNKASEEWIELQAKWKEIGRVKEEEFDALFKEQRALSDAFFQKKKEFFNELHRRQAQSRTMKLALVEEAEKWQDSTDWAEATKKIQQLQDNWKKIPVIEKDPEEGKLYVRFRKACQHFFNRKQEHYQQLKSATEEEIQKRKAFLEEIKATILPTDKSQAIQQIKAWEETWNSLGNARCDEKKELIDEFHKFIRTAQSSLQLSKSEMHALKFESRLKQALTSADPEDFFKKENHFLRKQYDEVKQRLMTYENNKAFFRHAKADNPMLKELNEKIAHETNLLNEIEKKRKTLKKAWDDFKNSISQSIQGESSSEKTSSHQAADTPN
ncbi:MAG: DUF349 domain-containing protein [Bacteroidia bacterium]|nr:DUF349 domain-containing protein [Bacteroidia bacterium]